MKTSTSRSLRLKRHNTIRQRVQGTTTRPRLVVHRSNYWIEAQLIDDTKSATLVGLTDRRLTDDQQKSSATVPEEFQSPRQKRAYLVGWTIAGVAKEQGIQAVVFDRSGYRYHGRVKAVAEGARAAGLLF